MRKAKEEKVAFGAEQISPQDKTARVQDLFAGVAGRYDRMNDLMSLGLHRVWKDATVARLAPRAGERVLDLAGGTGDIAFRLYRATAGRAKITLADMTEEMLARGRVRAFAQGVPAEAIAWCLGNAEDLPFKDESFDAVALAFGLRNMTHPKTALSEVFRVLDTGGRLALLEFSPPDTPIFQDLYKNLSRQVIPALGGRVAQDEPAYRYLVESIETFADTQTIGAWLKEAGFSSVVSQSLGGGVAGLHLAWKF